LFDKGISLLPSLFCLFWKTIQTFMKKYIFIPIQELLTSVLAGVSCHYETFVTVNKSIDM